MNSEAVGHPFLCYGAFLTFSTVALRLIYVFLAVAWLLRDFEQNVRRTNQQWCHDQKCCRKSSILLSWPNHRAMTFLLSKGLQAQNSFLQHADTKRSRFFSTAFESWRSVIRNVGNEA